MILNQLAVIAGMKARHDLRVRAASARAAPYIERAEAKRERRRQRNLRVAGIPEAKKALTA